MVFRKVALYLRKSREEESIEETLARHERMLIDYCKRNNLIIEHIYKEVVSGESLESRPQAQQMLIDVENGCYDGVVVIELERLSRGNQIDQVEILEVFKSSKTKIYTLNKTYDLSSDNEFDEEFFEFGLFMSRREYKTIKRRLIRGKKQAQKEGYFTASTLPFGYSKVKGDKGFILVPNEQTPIVQLIFNKYVVDGCSLADIYNYLNSNGIKTQLGSSWTVATLKRVLKNRCYIGYLNTNTRSDIKYIKGKHEPIIEQSIFDKAQEKLSISSHKVNNSHKLTNPLASIVKCSKCGATMQKTTDTFRCVNISCDMVSSFFSIVEHKLINELKSELKDFNYFLDNYGEEIEKENKAKELEIKTLTKELNKKVKMLDRACEMLELGIYTKEKYLERSLILERDKSSLESQINALKSANNDKAIKIKKAVPIIENCLNKYWTLNPEQKNELLKSFIDRVEYTKTRRLNRWTQNLDDIELKIYLKI